MMSRPAPAFRILAIATVAATLFLVVTLARARTVGQLPVKLGSDCTAAVVPPPPPPTPSTPPPAVSEPPAPFAAFGSCGDTTTTTPVIRR